MRGNIRTLGWLFIAWHGLSLLGGLLALMAFVLFGGLVTATSDAPQGAPLLALTGMSAFLFVVIAVLSVPGLLVGWGLLTFQPWARIGGIILAALNLTAFPLGTLLGIYALVTLCNAEANAEFH